MTEAEIQEEYLYRYRERIGILCGPEAPTPEQQCMALAEADLWMKNYRDNLKNHICLTH